MKTRVVLIVIMLCGVCLTTSQNVIQKNKPHKVWVTSMEGTIHKGILYSANEEMLKISRDGYSIIEIKATEINSIKIRRTNSPGRGAAYGAIAGLIVGGAAGFIAGDDPENQLFSTKAEEKALVGGLACAAIGTGVGTLFGTIKREIIIGGNLVIYNNQLQSLRDYSINPDSLE